MSKKYYDSKVDFVAGIVFLVSLIAICCIIGYVESHYSKNGYVAEINENEVVIVDDNGHEWVWLEEEPTYQRGDKVKMTMYTNHTDGNIFDDEIIKIKIKN